jgi:hypothetical protein
MRPPGRSRRTIGPGGFYYAERRSALGYPEVETTVGTLSVVMVDVGPQHRFKVMLAEKKILSVHSVRTVRTKRSA